MLEPGISFNHIPNIQLSEAEASKLQTDRVHRDFSFTDAKLTLQDRKPGILANVFFNFGALQLASCQSN